MIPRPSLSPGGVFEDEPDVRPDGICALPGCGKRLVTQPPKTMPKSLRPAFLAEVAKDPFCSAACARRHHKCQLPAVKQHTNPGGWSDPEQAARNRERQAEQRSGVWRRRTGSA